MDAAAGEARSTASPDYAERLRSIETTGWRRFVDVQAPYRWNIRRLGLGYTLDIGCGLGRNLAHLAGNGVGVDHNPTSIAIARDRGLEAYTVAEFATSPHAVPESFDSLLFAHVMEHMDRASDDVLVATYLPYLRPGGTVCFITPQERGYRSDATHVQFVDFAGLEEIAEASGLTVERRFSFPLPRAAGRAFTYNEFVVVARKA
ncbi:class I SAM-dependent methyltransferase [Agromyces intestinalis]|uniref:Class I SAM-dependent methyltransferase n=1 Tax=Agromyces intestinalis TaxID=2592652 RepID=A0A5C1YFJ3_9MICO|nr:class I SAM-dependent methyltransferase [Agromyces intestinalis]QEO13532.1 class I SAM-dependent methyltransferase [Agromyces intestinalis]